LRKIFAAATIFMIFLIAASCGAFMGSTSEALELMSVECCLADENHEGFLRESLLPIERVETSGERIPAKIPATAQLIEEGMRAAANQSLFVVLPAPAVALSKFEADPPVILLLPTQIAERK
jgi:hypothetical protein